MFKMTKGMHPLLDYGKDDMKPIQIEPEKRKINVLGTDYTVIIIARENEKRLEESDGFCDKTSKEIMIADFEREEYDISDIEWYRKKVIRHEIIHAFLFESGLHENFENHQWGGVDESIVDWIAIQFPKIQKVYEELEVL